MACSIRCTVDFSGCYISMIEKFFPTIQQCQQNSKDKHKPTHTQKYHRLCGDHLPYEVLCWKYATRMRRYMLYGYSEWGFYTTGVLQTIAMEDNIMLCGMQARDLKRWCKQEQKCSSLRSTTSTLYNTNYSNVASKEQLAMLNSVWHKSTIQEVERFHVINIPFLSTEPNSRYVPVLWGLKCMKCANKKAKGQNRTMASIRRICTE